ncbi:hypothetical protein VTK73DRAFT_2155 [Phialemonium thermophilum]|uniref:Uncharacterized protein n=1 Tax=Phialemonium thermophilum TaxID=223376 RepID=A0ABR3VSG6_9PEZI
MHSTDAYGFLLLQTLWLQCHCDLYRFLIPGIRECVSQAAFSATPPDYVHFCQSRCLDKATQLCDLWSDVSRLRPALVIDDHLFDVSVYQVTQVVHHLRHLLPAAEDDPHSLGRLQRKLRRAVQMASASHSGARRSTEALRTAASLLDVLGEGEVATVTRTTASDGNLQHLPSHGSLISTILDGAENPDENEHDGNNENDGIGKERGASSSAAASIGIAEHTRFAYPATTTYLSPSSSSSHLRRASGSTQPGPEETAWALGGLGFPSWDLLDIELNSLYGQAFDTPALSGG